jgi:hypothetical protein
MTAMDRMLHYMLYFIAVFCMAYVAIGFYFLFMPIGHWISYKSITPTKAVAQINHPLIFESVLERYRGGSFRYDDTLFCLVGEKFERYSQQITEDFSTDPTDGQITYRWPFTAGAPADTTCYLESEVVLGLPMGHRKSMRIIGSQFRTER